MVPTWRATDLWRRRLAAIGCPTVEAHPLGLGDVPGLAGSIVVSWCNAEFLRAGRRLRRLGCRLVWLNCMTWLSAAERAFYRRNEPLDAYVFQSRYQRQRLWPLLAGRGVRPSQAHLIRGALCLEEFPFAPRTRSEHGPLVIGRLSRPDLDKFAAETWSVYGRVRHPIHVRVMGWTERVEQKLGRAPDWAECLPPGAEPAAEFLASLDCMIQLGGGAAENWPRCGLEAMARGVPVVAENRWGWREMIRDGETGYLADDAEATARAAERLARDEAHRLEIARRARDALETQLAAPETLWSQWQHLFDQL